MTRISKSLALCLLLAVVTACSNGSHLTPASIVTPTSTDAFAGGHIDYMPDGSAHAYTTDGKPLFVETVGSTGARTILFQTINRSVTEPLPKASFQRDAPVGGCTGAMQVSVAAARHAANLALAAAVLVVGANVVADFATAGAALLAFGTNVVAIGQWASAEESYNAAVAAANEGGCNF